MAFVQRKARSKGCPGMLLALGPSLPVAIASEVAGEAATWLRAIPCTGFPPLDVIPVKPPHRQGIDQHSDQGDDQSLVRLIFHASEFDLANRNVQEPRQPRQARRGSKMDRFLGRLRRFLLGEQGSTNCRTIERLSNLFTTASAKSNWVWFWNMVCSSPKSADSARIKANIRTEHGLPAAQCPGRVLAPKLPEQQDGAVVSLRFPMSWFRRDKSPLDDSQSSWSGPFRQYEKRKGHCFDGAAKVGCATRWRSLAQADFKEYPDLPLVQSRRRGE